MVREFIQIAALMWCGWIKNAGRMSGIPQGCVLNAPKVLCLLHSKNNTISPHSSLGPIGSLPILWQRAECVRETSCGWFLCWMASIAESDLTPTCRLSLKKIDGACLFLQNSDGGVFLGNSEMPPPLHSQKHSIWLPLIIQWVTWQLLFGQRLAYSPCRHLHRSNRKTSAVPVIPIA